MFVITTNPVVRAWSQLRWENWHNNAKESLYECTILKVCCWPSQLKYPFITLWRTLLHIGLLQHRT